jgi:hypothetical protein
MTTVKSGTIPVDSTQGRFDAPDVHEQLVEEVIESLQPDRAHHDELGRTANGAEEEPSPREQPAEPIDLDSIDE